MKACNFLGAKKIRGPLVGLNEKFIKKITRNNSMDFIFNSQETDQREKLKEQDFIDYCALELKLCLLFGLRTVYCDYVSNRFKNEKISDVIITKTEENIKLALWMILRRRGVILIERGLLEYSRVGDPVSGDEPSQAEVNPRVDNGIELIFPEFIFPSTKAAFKKRLDLFLQYELPAGLTCKYHFANSQRLNQLIPAFVNWRNALRYPKKPPQKSQKKETPLPTLKDYANELAGILNSLSPDE
jgi:hypothetical protein